MLLAFGVEDQLDEVIFLPLSYGTGTVPTTIQLHQVRKGLTPCDPVMCWFSARFAALHLT